MKFQVTPSASGGYMTPNGSTVSITPADHGKDYADEATFAAALKLTARALYVARQTKISALQRALEKTLALGAQVTRADGTTKVKLNITPGAQAEWQRAIAGAQLAEKSGVPDTTLYKTAIGRDVLDITGASIAGCTLAEFFSLMAQAMAVIGAAEGVLLTKQFAVAAATTVEAVDAII